MDLCIGLEHEGLELSSRNGMLWRFLPLLDQLVDVVLVRDLDSRLSAREAAAVTDWLNDTQFAVHVMRDHPSHSWPMLGGMWGARFDSLKKKSNKDEENREEEDGKVNQEATKEEKVGESH